MKKSVIVIIILALAVACASRISRSITAYPASFTPLAIPPNPQSPGDAERGFDYLVNGNYLKSGIPAGLARKIRFSDTTNSLRRSGDNAALPYNFTQNAAANGVNIIAPNCLFCHAQKWEDSVVVGMGNSFSDFSRPTTAGFAMAGWLLKIAGSKKEQAAAASFLTAGKAVGPYLVTASRGVNIADRLTAVLAAHRDPASFIWQKKPVLNLPEEVIPTDVPAWWLLKKKNAMFYSGFGRGNFARFLMGANLLTVTDTSEAAEVLTHFNDVLAFLYSVEPPKYPLAINEALAAQGRAVFEGSCSKCHGTYGQQETYPNLLIPTAIIKTDSALLESNFSSPQFVDWFGKSWFTLGENPAVLVPFRGYIAPPLDGVWCTAPYLHNGSVPTIEALLNSKKRPVYWARNFKKPRYDYQALGWPFAVRKKQADYSTYNTTLNGYGNGGHYFGDHLSDTDRKAVIEYLKTL